MKFTELYEKNLILSCDTECLKDYWCFQFKRIGGTADFVAEYPKQLKYNPITEVYIFECFSNNDCKEFSKFYTKYILNNKAIMYFYNSTGYDKPMINIMLNIAETNETKMLQKVRRANDFIFIDRIDYKAFTRAYWINFFKDNRAYIDTVELFKEFSKESYRSFYNEFKDCFKNKVTKAFDTVQNKRIHCAQVLDIQVIGNFQVGASKANNANSKEEKTCVSLKQLQLVHLGENQKFDFNKYGSIAKVKEAGEYDRFMEYSENDIISLEAMYKIYAEKGVKNRFYAIKAVKDAGLKDSLTYDIDNIFSETDTKLIDSICAINEQQEFTVDYTEYIKTDIPEFNEFVSFLNTNQGTPNDNTLKQKYKEKTGKQIPEINLNGCIVTCGYGGAHGAISKYKNFSGNLYQLDYASQYPSIILEYKDLFANIMNVELYEAVYNLRLKYKKLKKTATNEKDRTEYDNIQAGLKLILNSTYGLINSTYKIKLANKVLGRFVILKGQSLLYNLCTRNLDKVAPNINTDGVYFELNSLEEAEAIAGEDFKENGEGYFKLEAEPVKWVIQNDVNNYILVPSEGGTKKKGAAFNMGMKQKFNSNSNIDINVKNALKLFQGDEITVEGIYFKKIKNIDCNKAHYFTSGDKGINPIVDKKQAVNITLEGEEIFITENVEHADLELYKRFAEITKTKIEEFKNNINDNNHKLIEDTEENNELYKNNINRIMKNLGITKGSIGYSGYKGIAKNYTWYKGNPIGPLANCGKTKIEKSIHAKGINVNAEAKLIVIDIDSYDKHTGTFKKGYPKELIERLNSITTYKTWNDKTMDFDNFKLIFNNDLNYKFGVIKDFVGYIETLDCCTVWTMEGLDRQYFDNDTKAVNVSEHMDTLQEVLNIENKDIVKHLEAKEEFKKNNKKITAPDNNNPLVGTLIQLLKDNDIKPAYTITPSQYGITFETACPYCSKNNTEHFKNNSTNCDAYINISEDKDGYFIWVKRLSATCDDKNHSKFNGQLARDFKESLNKQIGLRNYLTGAEFKRIYSRAKELGAIPPYKQDCFENNVLKIAGTGYGKTYSISLKVLECIYNGDVVPFVSTDTNTNVDNIVEEISKSLRRIIENIKNIEPDYEVSDKFTEMIKEDHDNLNLIGIYKMNREHKPPEEKELINCIITNHKYFYNMGHSAGYNQNMVTTREELTKILNKEIVLIMDEYETFEESGLIKIQLNEYMEKTKNFKSEVFYNVKAGSCLYSVAKKHLVDEDHYTAPVAQTKQHLQENKDGVNEYVLEESGEFDLAEDIERYTMKTNKPITYDFGNRKIFSLDKKGLYGYIPVDKVTELRVIMGEDGNKSNLKDLLKICKCLGYIETILVVGKMPDKNVMDKLSKGELKVFIKQWIEESTKLNTIQNFLTWCKAHITLNECVSVKGKLLNSVGKDLYYKYCAMVVKDIVEEGFKGNKHYLTANIIEPSNPNITLNTTHAHSTNGGIKNIEIIQIPKVGSVDKFTLRFCKQLIGIEYKTLIFCGLKKNIYENQELLTKNAYIKIPNFKQLKDNSESISTMSLNTVVAYANGSESNGRNYHDTELLVMNTDIPINVKDRIKGSLTKGIWVESLEEAQIKKITQGSGRPIRGEYDVKTIVYVGDLDIMSQVTEKISKYDLEVTVDRYTKNIKGIKKQTEAIQNIVGYCDTLFKKRNREGANNEELVLTHYNKDNRKLGVEHNKRNSGNKNNSYENIRIQYQKVNEEYLIDNPKKKSMSLRVASERMKIPKNTIDRALKEG